MSTSEGQHRWESLERKHERQDWDGMDTFGGKMMGILGEGCWGWSCQERGNGEGQKGGLWMWWNRTWLRLKWRRRIQLIGETGERKSAVATPDGKSRKKKKTSQRCPGIASVMSDTGSWPLAVCMYTYLTIDKSKMPRNCFSDVWYIQLTISCRYVYLLDHRQVKDAEELLQWCLIHTVDH